MEKRDYQDDFELFLQEEVKQHRMYPSDHLWKNIRTDLHGNRSWPALTFISLFVISALAIATVINTPPKSNIYPPVLAKSAISHSSPLIVSELKESNLTHIANSTIVHSDPINAQQQLGAQSNESLAGLPKAKASKSLHQGSNSTPANLAKSDMAANLRTELPVPVSETEAMAKSAEALVNRGTLAESNLGNTDKFLGQSSAKESFNNPLHTASFSVHPKSSKLGVQFYLTPSNSYRKLSDDIVKELIQPAVTQSSSQNVPLNAGTNANINQVVRHKPGLGFELGFAGIYAISSQLRLTTGAQLNVRKYQIETFESLTQNLSSMSLVNNRTVETISFYSVYNNNSGFKKTELSNSVYQLSLPIGIQWDLIKGKKLGLYSEASAQPTFIINNNSYLISTDYKNYGDGSELMRKWNINTSFGLILQYQTGSTSIQLGPQIRYQYLPTYSNAYPIKENLLDYGIKFGITKQLH